jgi:hypothetical protein
MTIFGKKFLLCHFFWTHFQSRLLARIDSWDQNSSLNNIFLINNFINQHRKDVKNLHESTFLFKNRNILLSTVCNGAHGHIILKLIHLNAFAFGVIFSIQRFMPELNNCASLTVLIPEKKCPSIIS